MALYNIALKKLLKIGGGFSIRDCQVKEVIITQAIVKTEDELTRGYDGLPKPVEKKVVEKTSQSIKHISREEKPRQLDTTI